MKKFLLIVSMCLCMMGMTACDKTDPTTVDYNGHTYKELQSTVQGTVQTIIGLSDEDKEKYLNGGQEMVTNMITRWDDATKGIGSYVDLGEFNIDHTGKTLTCTQEVKFEEKPVTVSFVYSYNKMELQDVNVDQYQSLGEKMSKAGLNTLMGIGTVFIILILISLIIYSFKAISYLQNKKKSPTTVIADGNDHVVEQITEREQLQDDLELTAVIAAAIAAATGTSTDDFVVRSIKRR